MSLSISPSPANTNQNQTIQFSATGGTSPYVFSLVSGIGSVTTSGLYTAPAITGVAVVMVTDSAATPISVQSSITVHSAITRFCDILAIGMNLDTTQVHIYDQKFFIPTDSRLYISVGLLSCKPFGNTRDYVPITGGLNELLSTNFQAILSLDIMSRSSEARDRKEEVIMALHSTYSQQQQQFNCFYIAPLSQQFTNLSSLDGSAIPYRYNISVAIQYMISKTNTVEFYDTFQGFTDIIDP